MRLQGKIFREKDGKGFSVIVEELNVFTEGDTFEKVLENARECIALALDGRGGVSIKTEDIEIFPINSHAFEITTHKIKDLKGVSQ